MGNKISFMPKYFRDFNIENRAFKQIDRAKASPKPLAMSPRHPSTAELFKQKEKMAPNIDEKRLNEKVIKSNIFSDSITGTAKHQVSSDKRPKKENEINYGDLKYDVDYQKYGYIKPDRIKTGNLTLRQFDELVNEFKQNKSNTKNVEELKDNLAKKYNLSKEIFNHLVEFYKPFKVITNTTKSPAKNQNEQNQTANILGSIFPNVGEIEEKLKTETKK